MGIERDPEAETEETEGCEPLNREAHRALQARPAIKAVVDRTHVIGPIELDAGAGVVNVADVEKGAHPGGLCVLGGHGEHQLVLAGEAQCAAIGIAELVLGSQAALAEAAHAIRTAAEELPVGWDRGAIPERCSVIDALEEREEEPVPD